MSRLCFGPSLDNSSSSKYVIVFLDFREGACVASNSRTSVSEDRYLDVCPPSSGSDNTGVGIRQLVSRKAVAPNSPDIAAAAHRGRRTGDLAALADGNRLDSVSLIEGQGDTINSEPACPTCVAKVFLHH
jgi:hypothetical protein